MAVTLPSDLLADVMRAADPSRLKLAAAKLGDGEQSRVAFGGVLDRISGSPRLRDRGDDLIADVLGAADSSRVLDAEMKLADLAPASASREAAAGETYKAFEQMVLRNMFESMMPPADSGIYGKDPSAGIWRSLANDQLASVYSDWGGLGIAQTLSEKGDGASPRSEGQWPYFGATGIRSFTG